MKLEIITCDRCGRRVGLEDLRGARVTMEEGGAVYYARHMDLCPSCADAMRDEVAGEVETHA